MSLAIAIIDETTDGKHYYKTQLELVSERITMRELIECRIKQEVEKHNSSRPKYFFGLVQPTNTEQSLNGYKLKKPRKIYYEKQIEQAIKSFKSNGFFVLIDDKQIEELDTPFTVTKTSKVSFIKLVPLIGG